MSASDAVRPSSATNASSHFPVSQRARYSPRSCAVAVSAVPTALLLSMLNVYTLSPDERSANETSLSRGAPAPEHGKSVSQPAAAQFVDPFSVTQRHSESPARMAPAPGE
eukprot:Amastigsp_a3374_6.p4 type:complete len:110 gc:universal Amastigsp_a3374_6:225-554(+)